MKGKKKISVLSLIVHRIEICAHAHAFSSLERNEVEPLKIAEK